MIVSDSICKVLQSSPYETVLASVNPDLRVGGAHFAGVECVTHDGLMKPLSASRDIHSQKDIGGMEILAMDIGPRQNRSGQPKVALKEIVVITFSRTLTWLVWIGQAFFLDCLEKV